MKKIILLILLVCLSLFTLVGCSGNVDIPGSAWATTEELTYEVKDKDTIIGTMVTKLERLPIGTHKLEKVSDDSYDFGNNGTKQTVTFKDNEGNVKMESETLLNNFTPVASYKMMNYSDKNYIITAKYDSKYYRYTIKENGVDRSDKIKTGSEFIDNELFYTIIRCYTLENANYSKKMTVLNPFSNSKESMTYSKIGTKKIEIPMPSGKKEADCLEFSITKSKSPVGKPIKVFFSPNTEGFVLEGVHNNFRNSYHLPVEIQEGDLNYKLTSIVVA